MGGGLVGGGGGGLVLYQWMEWGFLGRFACIDSEVMSLRAWIPGLWLWIWMVVSLDGFG